MSQPAQTFYGVLCMVRAWSIWGLIVLVVDYMGKGDTLILALGMIAGGIWTRARYKKFMSRISHHAAMSGGPCGLEDMVAIVHCYYHTGTGRIECRVSVDGERLVLTLKGRDYSLRPARKLTPADLMGPLITLYCPTIGGFATEFVGGRVQGEFLDPRA